MWLMGTRINIILPETTVQAIDRLARPGQRSRFIERAVEHYIATAGPDALQERLKAAALRDGDLDLEIAQDWYAVDRQQWQQLDAREPRKPSRSGAKSTSRRSTRR
jgi:CopG family transcriptional regulator / antitoxin EndoAI